MTPSTAAIYRFVGVLAALIAAVAVYVWLPVPPEVKQAAAGVALAAMLALEQFVKARATSKGGS